jgi:hypothetical protein
LEYLTVRNMMIKKDKILKIEDVPGDVSTIHCNYDSDV